MDRHQTKTGEQTGEQISGTKANLQAGRGESATVRFLSVTISILQVAALAEINKPRPLAFLEQANRRAPN